MMIYKRDRYDILLNRPGVLIKEEPVRDCHLVYGRRRSGKTTYLLNHARNAPYADILCFITKEMHVHEELRQRTATLLISPERLMHLRGQIFDWLYVDDYDVEGVLSYETITELWGLMDRARKGALVSIRDKASCKYFNMDVWKIVELGEPHF
jgi:hypothetical protein